MSDSPRVATKLPLDQQQVRANCHHPSGNCNFLPERRHRAANWGAIEQMVQSHPDRLAVRKASCAVTYQELNLAANRIAFTILAQHEGKAPVVFVA